MEENEHITFRDVCIAIGYVIAIGLNAYLIADQITDGESSRQLSLWVTKTRHKWRQTIVFEETIQREAPYVIWEAIQTVEGA